MAYNIEVKYYNSFWLKQATTPILYSNEDQNISSENPIYCKVFPGFPRERGNTPAVGGPDTWPNWPIGSDDYNPEIFYSNVGNIDTSIYTPEQGSKWVIEESRIKGAFNGTQVDLAVRAYLKEDSNDVRYRSNSLIYSGVFNSRTNTNNTNVFSIAEDITKSVDPHNGSIQLINAMDNNLIIFQENKVSNALIDKDAVYSAEGEAMTTQSNVVIGQVRPYTGDYGISRNPESFASFGFRRYFTDKDRNSVLRLSRDGLTAISNYGMKDFFRDEFAKIKDLKVVRSEPYKLSYNNSTGLLSQGPNNLSGQLQPAGFGNWVGIDTRGDMADVLIGSLIEINENFDSLNPNSGWANTGIFVTGTGDVDGDALIYISSGPIQINSTNLNPYIRFAYTTKDRIIGAFDNYASNYTISMQKELGSKTSNELSDSYNTLSFDETAQGWTTFYTYRPKYIFSLKNNFYSTKDGSLYKHYDPIVNHNNFYGVDNNSSISFVFNANPSISKNFKTISYEGSDGWQIESFNSDPTDNAGVESIDTINAVKSYQEGVYTENGIPYRVGFNRKDNRYVANIINNSVASSEEINFGSSITGIKGFFAPVKISTDSTTNKGGIKELFAVSTEFVVPSR